MLSVDYITNTVFNSRTYILSSDEYDCVWLVDCGDTDKVISIIGRKRVSGVFLTHVHSDHIYGLEDLISLFPTVKIYTNSSGVDALKSPYLNLSRYHIEFHDIIINRPENICLLRDGDVLDILGVSAYAYETPGHAPSCLTYLIEDKAFTGDSYIPGVKVFTGFPHANKKQAETSLNRILKLTYNFQIMPGHTLVYDKDSN